MRFGRLLPALLAFAAAAAVLMALAGAGTAASQQPAKSGAVAPDLRSVGTGPAAVAKIHSYLRSIGLDPRTVVIQTGKRNYAGPRCPGKRWTCTTATRVLQAGSDNVYQCSPAASVVSSTNDGGTQTCEVTQSNPAEAAMRRCYDCGLIKPLSAFAFHSIARATRQGRCRPCHAIYRRAHYLRNRATYVRREAQAEAEQDDGH